MFFRKEHALLQNYYLNSAGALSRNVLNRTFTKGQNSTVFARGATPGGF